MIFLTFVFGKLCCNGICTVKILSKIKKKWIWILEIELSALTSQLVWIVQVIGKPHSASHDLFWQSTKRENGTPLVFRSHITSAVLQRGTKISSVLHCLYKRSLWLPSLNIFCISDICRKTNNDGTCNRTSTFTAVGEMLYCMVLFNNLHCN